MQKDHYLSILMQPPGSGGLVSLINDQNTSANVNFAGLSVPNPAGLEMQLVLNSLYLDFSFFRSFFFWIS